MAASARQIHVPTKGGTPLHCPTVEDVEAHPLAYSAAEADFVPGSATGRIMAIPWDHPAVPGLRDALTVEASFVPSMGRRPKPTLFYRRQGDYLITSRMAFVEAGIRVAADARKLGTPLPKGTKYTNPRGRFPFQAAVIRLAMQQIKVIGGAMVVSPCGTGKSEMMSMSIEECGVLTLVLAPKCNIASQLVQLFRERFPMLTVEQLDGTHRKATPETHIIVAVTPSAANAPRSLFEGRGLIMLDEAHHGPARQVQRALEKCSAAKVMGWTATPYRSDGCEVIFPYMFGPTAVTVHRPWMPVVIRGLVFTTELDGAQPANYGEAINALPNNKAWTTMVLHSVLALARRAKAAGGRVLVLVDRIRCAMELCDRASGGTVITETQWKRLVKYESRNKEKKHKPTCVPAFAESIEATGKLFEGLVSSLYVGQAMTKRERDKAGKTGDIIWCTSGMAYEGLDLKGIHKEALFGKANFPQQHVGRCLRVTTMAAVPEVIFSAEVAVDRLEKNRKAQRKYFSDHEGWPIEWILEDKVDTVLGVDGTPPSGPTKTWSGHARAKRRGIKRKRGT